MRPAVFLDRDNTIIHNDGDLGDPDKVQLIQGAASAIASLSGLGFQIIVVTNQGGVARGKYDEEAVIAVHRRINEVIHEKSSGARIDAFYYCPYHPKGTVKKYKKEHPHRKPSPGMVLQAADDLKLDLSTSWLIGDAIRDIQAGHAAGTRTILIRADAQQLDPVDPAKLPGVTSQEPDADQPVSPDFFATDLIEAVRIIAQQRHPDPDEGLLRSHTKPHLRGRKWDAKRVAELQRVPSGEKQQKPAPQKTQEFRPWNAPASQSAEAEPIAATPFRKRFLKEDDSREEEAKESETKASESEESPSPRETAEAQRIPPPAMAGVEPAAQVDAPPKEFASTNVVVAPPIEAAIEQVRATAPAPRKPIIAQPPPPPHGQDIPEPIRNAKRAKKRRRPSADTESSDETQKLLRMILQELRNQRGSSGEFSYLAIIALVFQLVAVICLIGGFMMGGPENEMFLRWLGVGLMSQLAVIATLMFGK